MVHKFKNDISGVEIPKMFTYPFFYTPSELSLIASQELQEYILQREEWCKELSEGKMFGVLVVQNKKDREIGYIAAFSGILDGSNNHSFFVPPIYDMFDEDGYFKTEERAISAINNEIKSLEKDEIYLEKSAKLSEIEQKGSTSIKERKDELKKSKKRREDYRNSTQLSDDELSVLIKESQFEKAELKRLEREIKDTIKQYQDELDSYISVIEKLKKERKERSAALQIWLFDQFIIRNNNGDSTDLNKLFASTSQKTPPAGAGECAAPKLLQYAYNNDLQPISMGEFWWGRSPKGEVRHHGNFYPACRGKCLPILTFMMEGLDVEPNPLLKNRTKDQQISIIYEDDHLMVAEKPEGLLSVPGKEIIDSLYSILKEQRSDIETLFVCHRLDMATSGLIILAKSSEVYETMQRKFENREICKKYIALLDGEIENRSGYIRLPLIADHLDRPRQRVDFKRGKESTTRYEVLDYEAITIENSTKRATKVAFYPQTGRTHQLRLHSSHCEGLNCPIIGDTLYGKSADRLYLHASELIFRHPITDREVKIVSPSPF